MLIVWDSFPEYVMLHLVIYLIGDLRHSQEYLTYTVANVMVGGTTQGKGKTLDHPHDGRPSHVWPERQPAWAGLKPTTTT